MAPTLNLTEGTPHPDPERLKRSPGTNAPLAWPDGPAPQGGREFPLSLPLAPVAASRGFAVQRASHAIDDSEAEPAESPSDAPMVQGAWYETRVAVSRLPASAAPGAVAAPAGPHQAETDMDELAGKLYDRSRSRLKTELLVDRERAGFLTDLH